MATRILKRCKVCGTLGRVSSRDEKTCLICKNVGHEELTYPDYSDKAEEELVRCIVNNMIHIMIKAFDAIRPEEDDYFGCIEMCDYLKKKYNLDDDVYELLGIVNCGLTKMEHADYVPPSGKFSGRMTNIILPDGRWLSYTCVYYADEKVREFSSAHEISEEEKDKINADCRSVLIKMIEDVKRLKPYSTGRSLGYGIEIDFDFDLQTFKQAREKLYKLLDERRGQVRATEMRNKFVEEVTRPIENTNPNYVKGACCPNCKKESVYRISDIKRATSVGLFGLFSKNISKTMECHSCGYKW